MGFPQPSETYLGQAVASLGNCSSMLGVAYYSPDRVRVGWQVQGPDEQQRVFVQLDGRTVGLLPDQAVAFILDLATAVGVAAPGHGAGQGLGEMVESLLVHAREITGS